MVAMNKWVTEWKDMKKRQPMLPPRKEPLPQLNTTVSECDPEWRRGKNCEYTHPKGSSALQLLSVKEDPISMTLEDNSRTSDTHKRETSHVDYDTVERSRAQLLVPNAMQL